jgi:uncharacterized protein (TIGR02679 family)
MEDRERLSRLLGAPGLGDLRARLRRRFGRDAKVATLTLGGLGEAERAALCGLLGRRPGQGASIRFDIAEMDAVLQRAGLAGSLRHALEILDGPIVDLAAAREAAAQQWRIVQEECRNQRLAEVLRSPRGLGLLKRLAASDLAQARQLCRQAGVVLDRLPSAPVARSQLAAQLLGDAHALDSGRPAATLVLAALRAQKMDEEVQAGQEESDRAVWAVAGVLVNELARPALFLNLPAASGIVGAPGEPSYLSLRALLRASPAWRVAGRTVFICENPNVVAIAADVLGNRASPLVCTDGMPAAAQRVLIAQLRQAGARLRYHGDFDWAGIGIGNVVISQFGAVPWRFGLVDYLAAAEDAAPGAGALGEKRREASWDAALASAMQQRGLAIHEEAVTSVLLADLVQP